MNLFNSINSNSLKRNKFDLSHERKMTSNMGWLTPMLMQEVVPGDRFSVQSEIMMRLAPMLAPMMHRVNVYTHYFFVPNRLVWNEWESFITGGRQGDENPVFPTIAMDNINQNWFWKKTLADYLGLPVFPNTPTLINGDIAVSELPFRAYQLIFNEYYQDQNLTEPIPLNMGSGSGQNVVADIMTLRKRAWEKDYFTSCLPWAQRGGDVELPADIQYRVPALFKNANGDDYLEGNASLANRSNPTGTHIQTDASTQGAQIDNIESLGVTVNDLRKSVRLQEWLEKTARGGSRYIEQILSHFNEKSSDARLQRPEFLGGGKSPVSISEVLNTAGLTSETEGGNVQGAMSGHGISAGAGNGFRKKFEEHGIILGIMSVLPRTTYQDGVNRYWRKNDKFDFYWPSFANLGEQEVLNSELFFDHQTVEANQLKDKTFGYQSRYSEYKYQNSSVHGDFRDNLDYWHMGRKFTAMPVLNNNFVESDPTQRIFAVEDEEEHKLYSQIYNRISALRKMPYFGTPRL